MLNSQSKEFFHSAPEHRSSMYCKNPMRQTLSNSRPLDSRVPKTLLWTPISLSCNCRSAFLSSGQMNTMFPPQNMLGSARWLILSIFSISGSFPTINAPVSEARVLVYVIQDEQLRTKKAPYLRSSLYENPNDRARIRLIACPIARFEAWVRWLVCRWIVWREPLHSPCEWITLFTVPALIQIPDSTDWHGSAHKKKEWMLEDILTKSAISSSVCKVTNMRGGQSFVYG